MPQSTAHTPLGCKSPSIYVKVRVLTRAASFRPSIGQNGVNTDAVADFYPTLDLAPHLRFRLLSVDMAPAEAPADFVDLANWLETAQFHCRDRKLNCVDRQLNERLKPIRNRLNITVSIERSYQRLKLRCLLESENCLVYDFLENMVQPISSRSTAYVITADKDAKIGPWDSLEIGMPYVLDADVVIQARLKCLLFW